MPVSTSLVLLCAEDDDLDLVTLVHAARGRGIEPEVVPGIEGCDDPLVQAIRQFKPALFVVFESPHLEQARALEALALFERGRSADQQMILTRLEPHAPEPVLEEICLQLERLTSPSEDRRSSLPAQARPDRVLP